MPWIAAAVHARRARRALARVHVVRGVRASATRCSASAAYTVLEHKYYLDDFYMNGIVYPVRDRLSAAVYWFNQHVLDGMVNGAASVARGLSKLVMLFDRTRDRRGGERRRQRRRRAGGILRYLQSGNVQRYAAFAVRRRDRARHRLHTSRVTRRVRPR